MKIPISPRLLACAGLVAAGSRVADVGCDHGYLGIYLLTRPEPVRHVIASDVRPGPLACAVKNAEKYCVADKMSFHLSDGVRNIPRDFDTLVCAGMGADTMISIIGAAPWLAQQGCNLVLQCQSRSHELRRFLSENGWSIEGETVLRDGRFLYTVMDVSYRPDRPALTPGQWYFPPGMLENPGSETIAYYHRTCHSLRRALDARGAAAGIQLRAAVEELEQLPSQPWLGFLKEDKL